MINQKLNEYLETVIDLEQSIKVRENLIEDLKSNEIIQKKIEPYKELNFGELQKPKKPVFEINKPQSTSNKVPRSFVNFLMGLIIVVPLFLMIFFAVYPLIFKTIMVPDIIWEVYLFLVTIAYISIYLLWPKIKRSKNDQKTKENKEFQEENYRRLMKKYNKDLENYEKYKKERVLKEKRNKEKYQDYLAITNNQKNFLNNEINQLITANEKSRNILNKYYDLGFIHRDYIGDIAALSSFHDYIDKGICTDLEGVHQSYSRYENEKLIKELINYAQAQTYFLENIGEELVKIRTNQFTLYNILQENNDTSKRILRANQDTLKEIQNISKQNSLQADELNRRVDKLASTSAITAYNQERSRKELEYLRRMDDLEKGR